MKTTKIKTKVSSFLDKGESKFNEKIQKFKKKGWLYKDHRYYYNRFACDFVYEVTFVKTVNSFRWLLPLSIISLGIIIFSILWGDDLIRLLIFLTWK